MKLFAILFWATVIGCALAVFLDPTFPSLLTIIDNH
jgi:hypothetical protein